MKKFIIALILFPVLSFSQEWECYRDIHSSEMAIIKEGTANTINFARVKVPIPYRYSIKTKLTTIFGFHAESDICIGDVRYIERIKVKSTKNCTFCNAPLSEIKENNVSIRQRDKYEDMNVMLLAHSERTLLFIWNESYSLEIIDQNVEYLTYVMELFRKEYMESSGEATVNK